MRVHAWRTVIGGIGVMVWSMSMWRQTANIYKVYKFISYRVDIFLYLFYELKT